MKCKKCNTKNNKNAQYCVKCGAPLKGEKKSINLKNIYLAIGIITLLVILFLLTSTILGDLNSQNAQDNSTQVEINGVSFVIPQEGYYKDYDKYRFNFSDHICSIKKVDSFESSTYDLSLNSVKLDKYYPGGETYMSHTSSGDDWYGLKVKKDSTWFHISILTGSENEATEFFDWMYKNNDWEGHE